MPYQSPPPTQPGPAVQGRETVLLFMSSKAFASSAYVDGVFQMVNRAFSDIHPPHMSAAFRRLDRKEQITAQAGAAGSEVGESSSMYLLVFAEAQAATDPYPAGVIAVGACKPSPYHKSEELLAQMSEGNRSFIRTGPPADALPGVVDWELKLVAVGSQFKRQGIANRFVLLLEAEMRRRTAKALAIRDGGGLAQASPAWDTEGVLDNQLVAHVPAADVRIRILITTMEEKNGAYYVRRGWEAVARTRLPAGTEGGTEPFHIVHLDKYLT